MTLRDVAEKFKKINDGYINVTMNVLRSAPIPLLYCNIPERLKLPDLDGKKWEYSYEKRGITSSCGDFIEVEPLTRNSIKFTVC